MDGESATQPRRRVTRGVSNSLGRTLRNRTYTGSGRGSGRDKHDSLTAQARSGAQLTSGWTQPEAVQQSVADWFETHAQDWWAIYQRTSVSSCVRRDRLARALRWTDDLHLPVGSRVLDLGSGAGVAALALAQRGFAVTAVDPTSAMLHVTREHAADAGLDRRLELVRGDGHALGLAEGCYDLVLALGVIPYLHTPGQALDELRRVLAPGGHLIVSGHNPLSLTNLVDPRLTPLLRAPRRAARHLLEVGGLVGPDPGVRYFAPTLQKFDQLLADHGLTTVRRGTFGFGPFTVLGQQFLPLDWAVALNERLQSGADRGTPGLAHTGVESLFMALKAA